MGLQAQMNLLNSVTIYVLGLAAHAMKMHSRYFREVLSPVTILKLVSLLMLAV
jgi:hypothetical protein